MIVDSEFNGQYVVYVNAIGFAMTGYVVGQTHDGKTIYIQSDDPNVKDADWHFTVTRDFLPLVLQS